MPDTAGFPVTKKYYLNICCFLTFNFCAMVGSLMTSCVQWVSKAKEIAPYMTCVVLRVVLLPLVILPTYITSD